MKFLELKKAITEIKNSMDGRKRRMEVTEERISELKEQ